MDLNPICSHRHANILNAAIVDKEDGTRYLRTFCSDCRMYVETLPAVQRTGKVRPTRWVVVDFTDSPTPS